MMNHDDRLVRLVTEHEGTRYYVYDDHTGEPIRGGSLVWGNPTIGIGRNLAGKGITAEEAAYLLDNDIQEAVRTLAKNLAWFVAIDEVRAAALIDMQINMGWKDFSEFTPFFNFLALKDYYGAAEDLKATKWYAQNHGGKPDSRAAHVYAMIKTGQWPDEVLEGGTHV